MRFRCDANDGRADRVRVGLRRGRSAGARAARPSALPARLPPRRRRAALPPDRSRVGLGRGRRRAHRDHAGHVALDARPFVGRSPGRRSSARPTSKAAARPADRLVVPLLVEPDAARARRRHAVRDPPSAPAVTRVRVRGDAWSRAASSIPTGASSAFATLAPELRFDPVNRRVLGGTLHFTMADGSARPITVEAIGDTGFHLGAGLYFGLDGHHHGEWRGSLHVDGEHIADCTTPAAARRLHQIRDAVLRVDDPVGGGPAGATSRPRSSARGPTTASTNRRRSSDGPVDRVAGAAISRATPVHACR